MVAEDTYGFFVDIEHWPLPGIQINDYEIDKEKDNKDTKEKNKENKKKDNYDYCVAYVYTTVVISLLTVSFFFL
jgi:hypothetical protein